MNETNDLNALVGRDLAGVYFVRDYVQLYFDGPTLTLVTDPIIHVNGRSLRFPDEGSRELLCQLIGSEVTEVTFDKGVLLRLAFGSPNFIDVSLLKKDRITDEADAIAYVDLSSSTRYQWWL